LTLFHFFHPFFVPYPLKAYSSSWYHSIRHFCSLQEWKWWTEFFIPVFFRAQQQQNQWYTWTQWVWKRSRSFHTKN